MNISKAVTTWQDLKDLANEHGLAVTLFFNRFDNSPMGIIIDGNPFIKKHEVRSYINQQIAGGYSLASMLLLTSAIFEFVGICIHAVFGVPSLYIIALMAIINAVWLTYLRAHILFVILMTGCAIVLTYLLSQCVPMGGIL